jgi:protein-S-isoprenylcysteine O-methyltransferase Ste14
MVNFQRSGTTIRPDRASTSLVADRSLWSLILLPIVLLVIRRAVIAHEEAFLERRFGVAYTDDKTKVSRWL